MKWKMEACWYQIRHALSQSHLTTTSGVGAGWLKDQEIC